MIKFKGKIDAETELRSVICHVKELIQNDIVKPGERLPAERKIAADTSVSRAKVRQALERLESYGVLRILPQSGSVLVNYSKTALVKQFDSILTGGKYDFCSLVQVRTILETESVRQCARNHTEDDLRVLNEALDDFIANAYGPARDEKDFAFHAAIAKCSHNPVINNLLLIINPEILHYYRSMNLCSMPPEGIIEEHKKIVEKISAGDEEGAAEVLAHHFREITKVASADRAEIAISRI